jgi:hypothetical protein
MGPPVSVKPLDDSRSLFRDTIDIDAGSLTPRRLGVGKLVLPSSPTPVACACKDIVTADGRQ